MRNRAEKRHNDWKKAIRKKKIINAYGQDYYDNLHQYSKNNPFNSWGRGRAFKTNNKGKHRYAPGNFSKSKNWSEADRRKLDEMQDQMFDNE